MTVLNISSYFTMLGVTGGGPINSLTQNINSMTNMINTYSMGDDLTSLVIDTDSKAKTLTGDQLEAELETGEIVDNVNVMMMKKAYLPIEAMAGTATVIPKSRFSIADAPADGPISTVKADCTADFRVSGKRHAINLKSNGFSSLGSVIQVDILPTGRR
jgi:hypothetical protein